MSSLRLSDRMFFLKLWFRRRRRMPGARFERGDIVSFGDSDSQVRVLSVAHHEATFVYRVRFTEPPRVTLWQPEPDLRR